MSAPDLPIDLTVGPGNHLTAPDDPRPIWPSYVFPMINGQQVRGVQRLVIRDQDPSRIVELHVLRTVGNHPIEGVSSNLYVEVLFKYHEDEPAGMITLIGGALTHAQADGRDVWVITGKPAEGAQ